MTKKEIGGYFQLERFYGHEYYADLIALNTGRNALLYILKARKVERLYIPYFLCNSVAALCDREGYSYEYYSINEDFLPIFAKKLRDKEYLYIVNFYGQLTKEKIQTLKEIYGNIILDNAQAFFQKPILGIDTIYSCRKFFGVPDGAYLSTDTVLGETLDVDVSKDRVTHLLGRFEDCASEYYEYFKRNDESFKTLPLRYMSRLTHNILVAIDYEGIRNKRNENYGFLEGFLTPRNKLSLRSPNGPYCYPFYHENGMEIKKRLAQKGVFIPTLWPNVLNLESSLERDWAENILPLPCDQRYDKDDISKVLEEVSKCIN